MPRWGGQKSIYPTYTHSSLGSPRSFASRRSTFEFPFWAFFSTRRNNSMHPAGVRGRYGCREVGWSSKVQGKHNAARRKK